MHASGGPVPRSQRKRFRRLGQHHETGEPPQRKPGCSALCGALLAAPAGIGLGVSLYFLATDMLVHAEQPDRVALPSELRRDVRLPVSSPPLGSPAKTSAFAPPKIIQTPPWYSAPPPMVTRRPDQDLSAPPTATRSQHRVSSGTPTVAPSPYRASSSPPIAAPSSHRHSSYTWISRRNMIRNFLHVKESQDGGVAQGAVLGGFFSSKNPQVSDALKPPLWARWGDTPEGAARVVAALLTDEEVTGLLHGAADLPSQPGDENGSYVSVVPAISRLGIPSLNIHDAGQGFRPTANVQVGQSTSWPCLLALGATWDPGLALSFGQLVAREFRSKGANVLLGPSLNVHRVPAGGRNAELLSGEDGHLGAVLGSAYILGVQSEGVVAVAKHFIGDNQELKRGEASSDIDERTLWEVYYPPFEAAVKAGVGAVMCSSNKVDGEYACGNEKILQRDLRGKMGFEGWVMSDRYAVHSTEAAAGGVDQEMPYGDHFSLSELSSAKVNVREMAERVLRTAFRVNAFEGSGCDAGIDCDDWLFEKKASSDSNQQVAKLVAAKSVVLLKNEELALPLTLDVDVAVVGSACDARQGAEPRGEHGTELDYFTLGGSGRVYARDSPSILQALRARGLSITKVSLSESIAEAKHAWQSLGSEALEKADPQWSRVVYTEGVVYSEDSIPDVVIACGGGTAGEGFDRESLSLDQDDFLSGFASWLASIQESPKPQLIVLAMAPGAITASWVADADAAALMFFGGQMQGDAWADVLLGKVNPSGKLPVTIPLSPSDVTQPCKDSRCPYEEGLFAGWRGLIGKPVAFPFGHGLSYTQFSYEWAKEPRDHFKYDVSSDSFDSKLEMAVEVTNTGLSTGSEVVQLYMQYPPEADEPARVLRGFSKTFGLMKGKGCLVHLALHPRDLAIWRANQGGEGGTWQVMNGTYILLVGSSSRDIRLEHEFHVEEDTQQEGEQQDL